MLPVPSPLLVLPGPLLKKLSGSVSRAPHGTIKDRLHLGFVDPRERAHSPLKNQLQLLSPHIEIEKDFVLDACLTFLMYSTVC